MATKQYTQNVPTLKQDLILVQDLILDQELKRELSGLFANYPLIQPISEEIVRQGGTVYLVGGAVRDLLLGSPVHDLDIEVHGLSMEQLGALLEKFGIVSAVGKSFGVLKLHGSPIDWSLPRTDSSGRKPEVSVDPTMTITQALMRRDLTMNAMAIELGSAQLIDPFHGLQDMRDRVLRSPDIQFFCEDPLRFYRVMQFIGRFEMQPDELLQETCRTMDIAHVSRERIEDEFEKLLLKSVRPSVGLRWLAKLGRLKEILPELARTQQVKQEPEWHPEGNVFEHLMQTLDAAAGIARSLSANCLEAQVSGEAPVPGEALQRTAVDDTNRSTLYEEDMSATARSTGLSSCLSAGVSASQLQTPDQPADRAKNRVLSTEETLILLFAGLCHDLGKITTTINEKGRIRSPGHDQAGVPLTRALLKRMTLKVKIVETVCLLVRWHMQPPLFVKQKAQLGAYRRLALKLAKYTTMEMQGLLSLADRRGRNAESSVPLSITPEWFVIFLKNAREAKVLHRPEPQILHGQDIIDLVSPGPEMGKLLHYAYELQLDEGIKNKDELRAAVIKRMRAKS